MIWDILFAIIAVFPIAFLASMYGDVFGAIVSCRCKRATSVIMTSILCVLLIILHLKVILPWVIDLLNFEAECLGRTWLNIVSAILVVLLCIYSFGKLAKYATICPHCGAWNDYTDKEILTSGSYDAWETVDRKIKDKNGNTIGTYEDKELKTRYYSCASYKCAQCGKTFIKY